MDAELAAGRAGAAGRSPAAVRTVERLKAAAPHEVDELLVAHDLEEVDPSRTLEELYLRPLRERVDANGGSVHPGAPPFLLLIDVKSGAEPTYARLHPLLRRYADLFTFALSTFLWSQTLLRYLTTLS